MVVTAAVGSAGGSAVSLALMTRSVTLGGNTLSTAAHFDTTPPTISASVISKTTPYLPGSIRPSRAFYVYANVTDPGTGASGVASVTANVSAIKAGSTTVALVAGSYSVGGVSYNYRSASTTADNKAAGTYSDTITATDNAANQATSTFSVVVDTTVPSGTDVQATNHAGGTVGRPELGDTIVLTFSEPIDPQSLLANWTGASTSVVVRFTDSYSSDTVAIWNAANTAQLPLGSVATNGNYVTANVTFGASGTASTMTASGSTITITLGTASSTSVRTNTTAAAMTWTPSATATDAAGNACSTTTATETGTNDVDF